jgi:hypothetical protein
MRKMILALAVVLLAAPAWAAVTITLTGVGNEVTIGYDATTELQRVRAFALDVTATGGTIVGVAGYKVGDDNHGYGIFPGNFSLYITVNPTTGLVDSWNDPNYTPVAPADDPGALGGLGTDGITIEMGSLYDANWPAQSGVLCKVTVSAGTTKLCVNGNAIRGNIVMEDAAEVPVVEACIPIGTPDCFPSTDAAYADWVTLGKPDCWCYPRQCKGDADGLKQGSALAGYMYVGTNDLNKLISGWKILDPPKGPGVTPVQACADFDHLRQGSALAGYMRVGTNDLNRLIAQWKVLEPPKGAGVPADCLPGNRNP